MARTAHPCHRCNPRLQQTVYRPCVETLEQRLLPGALFGELFLDGSVVNRDTTRPSHSVANDSFCGSGIGSEIDFGDMSTFDRVTAPLRPVHRGSPVNAEVAVPEAQDSWQTSVAVQARMQTQGGQHRTIVSDTILVGAPPAAQNRGLRGSW